MQTEQTSLNLPFLDKKQNKNIQIQPVSFLSLFRYSTTNDKLLMVIGSIAAMIGGTTMPLSMVIFSQISTIFTVQNRQHAAEDGLKIAIKLFIVGAITWFLNFVGVYCWTITGKRQTIRFKKMYYKVLLDQQIAWYDSNDVNKLSTQISNNMVAVEGAVGQKIALLCTTIVTTIYGFFYAFFKCWQLSLVLTGFLPLILIAGVLMMKGIQMKTSVSKLSYEEASGIAEQAFSSIKTVKSFVAEKLQQNNFLKSLTEAQKKVAKYTIISSASFGLMMFFFLGIYSFGFWFSKYLIISNEKYDSTVIMGTLFCFLLGGGSIGQISPILKNIAEAKVSAAKLYYLIDREKTLIQNENGINVKEISHISFKNVIFGYKKVQLAELANPLEKKLEPKDTQQSTGSILTENKEHQQIEENSFALILNNLSIEFEKGKITALVGESGSGKSTVIQLLMRYYDPIQGQVTINDHQMKNIDIKDFRRKVGYVGQEPVLFSMTIAENIRLSNQNLTDGEIIEILKKANAWQFVSKCEKGINTYVGSSGAQLSGGQKQRIAIARAIAKNPRILILDEATSALDRKNQKEIHKTLSSLSTGNFITVVVAHRLSTVRNADKIIVLGKGKVLEEGSHQELFAKEGAYHQLVKSQVTSQQLRKETDNKEEEDDQNMIGAGPILNKKKTTIHQKQQTKQEEPKFTDQQLNQVYKKLLKQLKGSYLYLIFGCLTALLNGLVWPFFNLAFSQIMAMMYDAKNYQTQINWYCLMFLLIALASGLATFAYMSFFGIAGEKLVFTIRKKLFTKLLRMPVSFYQESTNTPGGLSTRLSQDAYQINNLITGIMGVICLNFATVSASLFLAFYYSWQLTLVVLGISPMIALCGSIHMKVVKAMHEKSEKFEKSAGALISDTVCSARTVKSFGNDLAFINIFNSKLDEVSKLSLKSAFSTSFLQGLSNGMSMIIQGFTFWIAGMFFTKGIIEDPAAIYVAIFSIIFAAMGVGQNSQFLPQMGKSKVAGASIYEILQSEDEVEAADKFLNPTLNYFKGDIEFKNVNFKYPQRDGLILTNLSFTIKKGQKIAFVGPSGSGKSTIIQILMRFYPIQSGQIKVDGQNYLNYNIHSYRKQLGLVSQQPTLFLGSIKDNIIYGSDNKSQQQIEKCAEIAHASVFINDMPQKYNKQVGQKGSQVSGGQKQRIALARCLIKNPQIILMDEATSALDTDTEKIVLQNLKPILQNRTSIAIAHRFSTIEDCDRIIVMRDGQIIEQGKYGQLMQKKESFYRLAKGLN